MNLWSNIIVSPEDEEIGKIDVYEQKLEKIPESIHGIRELITRFEVCHFKFQKHLQRIKEAITNLEIDLNPENIGKNHLQHGDTVWTNDHTGRSLLGQQYVWALQHWLGDLNTKKKHGKFDDQLFRKIQKWLGEKNDDKARMVRLLLARLKWDWKQLDALQEAGKHKELEVQLSRMDICHYAFPLNLERVVKGIGRMKPVPNFEGCGTFNKYINNFIEQELHSLDHSLKSLLKENKPSRKKTFRIWLLACLIKTMKEQVELSEPIIELR